MTSVASNTSFPTPKAIDTNTKSGGNTGVITDKDSFNKTFDQFLLMLTTELKNQDPTSPMDTAQFTNQLVGFSQVEQQLKSNASLDKLVTAATSNQTQLGLSYIGLDVSMKGNQFNFDPAKISKIGISYNLANSSAKTTIHILDSKGNVVYAANGSTTKGENTFTWDGKKSDGSAAPAGTYTVQIGALDANQEAIDVTTQVPGLVTGMQTAPDGTIQLVVDNTQAVALSDITSAWVPGSNAVANNNSNSNSNSSSNNTNTGSGS